MSHLRREIDQIDRKISRLQVFTPLSLLVFGAASAVASVAVTPSLGDVSDDFFTIATPQSSWIGLYWGVIFILLVGQSVLLASTTSLETKDTLVRGVGARLAIINFLMTGWVLFWCLHMFWISEAFILVALILAASSYATLSLHPTSLSRPLEYAFIHTPMRMLVVILFSCDIWQNGLLALGQFIYVGPLLGEGHKEWEANHEAHGWIMFAILLGVGLINSLIVYARRDVIWALASIYLCIALTYSPENKPEQLIIALILSASATGLALLASYGVGHLRNRLGVNGVSSNGVRLPEGEEAERQRLLNESEDR